MLSNSPKVKKIAVSENGGQIIKCEPTIRARQRTACNELLFEQQDLDIVFCPVGGGGFIASSALAVFYFGNNCKVIGGEPLEANDAYRSLLSGKIVTNKTINTIADGLRTQLGHHNFPIIKKHLNCNVRPSEVEIMETMRIISERMKIIVESSSAVAFAAVLKEKGAIQK